MSLVCITALLHEIDSPCRPVSSCTGDVYLSVAVPRVTCIRVLSRSSEVWCDNRGQSRRVTLACVCRCMVKPITTVSQQLYSSNIPASRQAYVPRVRLAQFRLEGK